MIAYFDCFSGISGDMTLGALVDAGGNPRVLDEVVSHLGLTSEVCIRVEPEERGHIFGTRVHVDAKELVRRDVPQMVEAVDNADLPGAVRQHALGAMARLAEAESRLHHRPTSELVLHELSGCDTLIDLVGAFWLLDDLGVSDVYASALPTGRGVLPDGTPLPAPAMLEVLAGTGAVIEPVNESRELVTPTGAAILAEIAVFERPAMAIVRAGYGIGTSPGVGNALRVWLGEPVAERAVVTVLETNLDDMAPNQLGGLMSQLMAMGALDVSVAPLVMKKNRPGHLLSVLCNEADSERLATYVLRATPTLGVRIAHMERVCAEREVIEVPTAFGLVHVKLKKMTNAVVDLSPEYDDCLQVANATGATLREVMRAAEQAAWAQVHAGISAGALPEVSL
jgi:uncharacterized protein (TIGR00299 family) protein